MAKTKRCVFSVRQTVGGIVFHEDSFGNLAGEIRMERPNEARRMSPITT
jgi:hypothetical protein